jgi:hypothetical protein
MKMPKVNHLLLLNGDGLVSNLEEKGLENVLEARISIQIGRE